MGDATDENRCKTAIPLVGSVGPHGVRVPLRAREILAPYVTSTKGAKAFSASETTRCARSRPIWPSQSSAPYFLWDEDVSIGELHQALAAPDGPRRDQLLAKMLREARDIDVWDFVRPVEVARVLERLRRRIGRRYAFWSFLIEGWRRHGLLGS